MKVVLAAILSTVELRPVPGYHARLVRRSIAFAPSEGLPVTVARKLTAYRRRRHQVHDPCHKTVRHYGRRFATIFQAGMSARVFGLDVSPVQRAPSCIRPVRAPQSCDRPPLHRPPCDAPALTT